LPHIDDSNNERDNSLEGQNEKLHAISNGFSSARRYIYIFFLIFQKNQEQRNYNDLSNEKKNGTRLCSVALNANHKNTILRYFDFKQLSPYTLLRNKRKQLNYLKSFCFKLVINSIFIKVTKL
jgi:hypothetical protein